MGIYISSRAPYALPNDAAHVAYKRNLCNDQAPLIIAARQLVHLNLQYLSLAPTRGGFPEAITAQLNGICHRQKLSMADCQFSLFTLALNDGRRWLSLLNRLPTETTLLVECSRDNSIWREFATTVVFLTWHLAQSQPLAAKLLLGMDDDVASALRCVPIAQLRSLSHSVCNWLEPRWPQHPIFWSALLSYSRDASGGGGLAATKLLGRQLLAAESLYFQFKPKAIGERHLSPDMKGRSSETTRPPRGLV